MRVELGYLIQLVERGQMTPEAVRDYVESGQLVVLTHKQGVRLPPASVVTVLAQIPTAPEYVDGYRG